MEPASLERILSLVPDDAVVLDVGGWGKPLPRAGDWVIDVMPYETRGLYGYEGHHDERFTADTWLIHDICERQPFPLPDKSMDFVVCSHTLEDIRDPIWVCNELQRVAKAGYIETPSRLEEQTYGVQGPWVGWSHHRWLVEECDGGLDFVFKHHVICGRDSDHLPAGALDGCPAEERILAFSWTGSFPVRERWFDEPADLDRYLQDFVVAQRDRLGLTGRRGRSRSRR